MEIQAQPGLVCVEGRLTGAAGWSNDDLIGGSTKTGALGKGPCVSGTISAEPMSSEPLFTNSHVASISPDVA